MKISVQIDSIFTCISSVLVYPINIDGYMGGDLNKDYKQAYPDSYFAYMKMVSSNVLKLGNCEVLTIDDMYTLPVNGERIRYIALLTTKRHYNDATDPEVYARGLRILKEWVIEKGLNSIGLPLTKDEVNGSDLKTLVWTIITTFKGMENFTLYLHIDESMDWEVYYILKELLG